ALLGFGIAGCLLSLGASRLGDRERSLARALAAFAVTTVAAVALASRTPQLLDVQSVRLGTCYLLLALPFLCAGFVIGLLLMQNGPQVHRLYAADLVASAGGALVFAYLLQPIGAEGLVWAASFLAAAALLVHTWSSPLRHRALLFV